MPTVVQKFKKDTSKKEVPMDALEVNSVMFLPIKSLPDYPVVITEAVNANVTEDINKFLNEYLGDIEVKTGEQVLAGDFDLSNSKVLTKEELLFGLKNSDGEQVILNSLMRLHLAELLERESVEKIKEHLEG